MTEEQIAKLRAVLDEPTDLAGGPPDLAKDCERLLEERKRLLAALQGMVDGFYIGEGPYDEAQDAIAFAEEEAP